METVNKNLNSILTNINALCAKNGMDSNAIEIIGASKFRSIETLRELSSGGVVTVFGENKVQFYQGWKYILPFQRRILLCWFGVALLYPKSNFRRT